MANKNGANLKPADVDRIIVLKLDGIGVLAIAAEVGCNKDTVTRYWHEWLDATSDERREFLERHRSEVIAHLQAGGSKAMQGAMRAQEVDDMGAEVRYLAEARQAWRMLSTVAGFDAPIKIQTATFEAPSEEEARARLDKL